MSDKMYKIRDMLCDELDRIADHDSLSVDTLNLVDKISHSIKSIDTILAMEETGYSNDYYNDYSERGSYARGRGRYAKRDSRGRYSSREGRGYYDNSYRRGERGYSRAEGKHEMLQRLEEMLESASDEQERTAIQKCMSELED